MCRSTFNLSYRRLQPKKQDFIKYNKEQRMRVSGKRQGIDKWSNGWSFSTDFLRRKSKCEKKCNEVNEDNSLTHFTLSVLLVFYKWEEVEIRHETSRYYKEQLPSLTSTQLVFFDEVHVQQVCGPPVTSKVNKHSIRFPRDEEGNVDVKNGQYGTSNQPKRLPSSMNKKEGSVSL